MNNNDPPLVLRLGGRYKPEIRVQAIDDTPMLVKDYRPCGVLFRLLFGRWLVTREFEAYCAARGIPGVSSHVQRLDPYALAIEYVSAQPYARLHGRPLSESFWTDLTRIVDSLHARHIAHGDLKTQENILVTDDGSVRLIDFSSAAYSRVDLVHLICYPHLREDDRRSIVKAKLQVAPELVTEEDLVLWERRSAVERLFRWAREYVRPVIKFLGGRSAATAEHPSPGGPASRTAGQVGQTVRAERAEAEHAGRASP